MKTHIFLSGMLMALLFCCSCNSMNATLEKAEKGDSSAQYELGMSFLKEKKNIEAEKWLKKASESGHPEALFEWNKIQIGMGNPRLCR